MADAQITIEAGQETARVTTTEVARLEIWQIQQNDEEVVEDDDGNILMAQFLTPATAPDHSSIVYHAFGRHEFQLRADLINLFSNNLQLYGKSHENLNTHLSRFLRMCRNF
ncbi:Uncharacterized protein Adt_18397 [Abeliophyllum distichum]|uniref:Uncharacterized protein n=1 Tax=Abeliophyllum distichum TaxID=126358 RepID=A0ABD1TJA1_9LAMI